MLLDQDVRQLVNQCFVELTGASEAGVKAKMFEVMTEFFNDSSCWRECIPFNAVPDKTVYHLQPVEGQIIRLSGVSDVNNTFYPALMADMSANHITLRHAPNTAQQLFAKVVKNVSLPTHKGIPIAPDWVLQKWHLGIKHGIVGQLMNEQNKSYSDKKGALYNLSQFRRYINEARAQSLRANTEGAAAWRFPQTFRANTQQGGVPTLGTGNDRVF